MPTDAQICHQANGTKLVEYDGAYMTESLTHAMYGRGYTYALHAQQIQASQQFSKYLRLQKRFPKTSTPLPAPKKFKRFPLKALPSELRTMVLQDVVEDFLASSKRYPPVLCYAYVPQRWSKAWKATKELLCLLEGADAYPLRALPAISRAGDSKIRLECIKLMLEYTTIWTDGDSRFSSESTMHSWLEKLDFGPVDTNYRNGLDATRSLVIAEIHHWPVYCEPEGDFVMGAAVARQFRNLRSLSFELPQQFAYFSWTDKELPMTEWEDTTPEWLRSELELDSLLDLEQLRYLHIIHKRYSIEESTLQSLVDWLVSETTARGRRLEVTIKYNAV